jgi:hypothetical protein
MRCQRTGSPTKRFELGPRGVIVAALGTLLTATAVCQTQPNAPPNTQAEKPATTTTNQAKRPAVTPTAPAKQSAAATSTAPKPSMMDKARSLFGMKKSSADTPKSDQKPEQSHSFLDLFHSHDNNAAKPTPDTHGVATNAVRTPANQPAERAPSNQAAERTPPTQAAERAQHNLPAASGVTRPAVPMANETRMPNGNVARTARDGSLRELHSAQNNMSIRYGMNGSRQIRVDQPDGSRVVLASRGAPYVQRPWNFGGHAFDHRTYIDNGVLTHQFYRPYPFGSTTLDAYAPQRFYSQDFYKWVAKPQMWTPPAWSYVAKQEPWYTHNQGYFTPQSSYASPVFWLTDFVLAMSLFEAYNAHPLPAQAPPPIPAIPTPQSSPSQTPIASSPIVQAPIAAAPSASAPIAPASAPAAPIVQPPVASPRTDDQGASLSIWQRFINYIQDLLGQTPTETASSSPAPAIATGAAPITDDVKNKVADEVEAQVAEESREADVSTRGLEPKAGQGGVVEELGRPAQHVFVVASDLDLVDDNGRRCMISEGDVVQILSNADANSGTAPGIVLSSKGGVECAQSAKVDIAISDLQEMQNHMRAAIDQGLANTPRGASEPTVTPPFAQAAPPPDADAKNEIEKQKTIAASVERG